TLGESLALGRSWMSFSALAKDEVAPFGAVSREEIVLIEVDTQGRQRRAELFDPRHLGDAIARLYERYAELPPDGPDRTRASATARSVASMTGVLDHDRMASAIVPNIVIVDHRLLGTWSARGAEEVLQHIDSWLAVGEGHHGRESDVLALQPDALLIRRTF